MTTGMGAQAGVTVDELTAAMERCWEEDGLRLDRYTRRSLRQSAETYLQRCARLGYELRRIEDGGRDDQ
ncbi:MAG: hypothetical protein IT335_04245 [Thermomicrobiales bacterium]|nr:hypothetical protein [Thermomicrobiales bacterium]